MESDVLFVGAGEIALVAFVRLDLEVNKVDVVAKETVLPEALPARRAFVLL